MLVRALKVLRSFLKGNRPARPSPRQPLISRATKVALMAEQAALGNGEPWNRPIRRMVLIPPNAALGHEDYDKLNQEDCPFSRFSSPKRPALAASGRRHCRGRPARHRRRARQGTRRL